MVSINGTNGVTNNDNSNLPLRNPQSSTDFVNSVWVENKEDIEYDENGHEISRPMDYDHDGVKDGTRYAEYDENGNRIKIHHDYDDPATPDDFVVNEYNVNGKRTKVHYYRGEISEENLIKSCDVDENNCIIDNKSDNHAFGI